MFQFGQNTICESTDTLLAAFNYIAFPSCVLLRFCQSRLCMSFISSRRPFRRKPHGTDITFQDKQLALLRYLGPCSDPTKLQQVPCLLPFNLDQWKLLCKPLGPFVSSALTRSFVALPRPKEDVFRTLFTQQTILLKWTAPLRSGTKR